MEKTHLEHRALILILVLTASSLSCTMQRNLFSFIFDRSNDLFQQRQEEIFSEQFDATIEVDELVSSDTSKSILDESGSYGSEEDSISPEAPEAPAVSEPVLEECAETGICTAVYPTDIRGTANPPDVMVFANAAEYPPPAGFSVTYSENAGPWYEWLVLKEPGDYVQISSPSGYSKLGIQFWGDQTNGWARVTLDGVEVWRGDITAYGTDGVNYFVYVEFSGIETGSHTLRAEVLGQPGKAGGDNVPVFYFAFRE